MLSSNDKIIIRDIIREELRAALVRQITIERGPRAQGDPETIVREEEWNVLEFMAAYAPKIEAAMRGMQEDLDQAKNDLAGQSNRLDIISRVMLDLERPMMAICGFADEIRQIADGRGMKRIEGTHEGPAQ